MARFDDILEAIGNTPMVKLGCISPSGGATIYGKCEFMNPGGSTKDRMAQHIIKKAMERGDLKPGGVIVENTSGNTGAGLAVIAAVHGCRLILTMPDKMSQEKIDMLRGMGAKVVVTPTNVPADSPDSYYETAKRIAREIPGAFYVNQYHNKDNIEAHYLSTGREIWEDMDGQIDALVVGAGTGGTISGVARYLKERNPDVVVVGVDPIGSVYYDLFTNNRLVAPQVYKVEGIGEDMVCDALEFDNIDRFYQVNDKECFRMTRRLAREEGLFVGGSSGGAAHVAVKLARELGPGKSVITVFPDSGSRYLSKVYSDEWMQVNGFLEDEGVHTAGAVLAKKGGSVVWVRADDTILQAGSFLKSKNISQAPVADENGKQIGTITEQGILTAFVSGSATDQRVTDVMDKPLPIVAPATSLSKVSEVLLGQSALLVGENDTEEQVEGILSRIDIIEFLSRSA
jgi:cystathionine beta-synthase